tara:strand:+ start:17307 stop:18434 length:1128 start_codon:yes stop_codon:yes gene_type:complete
LKIKKNIKVFIIATEQSGDNLGSDLIKYLKMKYKYNISFYGIGGDKMIKEGLVYTNHVSDFKSIGFFEILINLRKILSILSSNIKEAIKLNPDLVITIDSPDFSFRFVKRLKNHLVKTKFIHYVAPSVWAWREGRAKDISRLYDLLLTIFPFEKSYFKKYNLKTVFVGNPIFNNRTKFKIPKKKKYIALMPGSRLNEVNSLEKYFKFIINHIHSSYPQYSIYIPTLPYLKKRITNLTSFSKKKIIISDNNKKLDNLFPKTKIAIVCSGTAALEMTKKNIPIIVIYKLNLFTEILFSFFVKTKFANIINIMAKKSIIPEITNHKLNISKLKFSFDSLIKNEKLQKLQIKNAKVYINKLKLGKNCSYNACLEILKII